jgi:hypothetical protein
MEINDDRNFMGNTLFIDLIPKNCWAKNARNIIAVSDWNKVRKQIQQRADYKCECCGWKDGDNGSYRLEIHERWDYDEEKHIQILKRLVCLCNSCHNSTHIGKAQIDEKEGISPKGTAMRHLMKVTGMNQNEFYKHKSKAFEIYHRRNRCCEKWQLDISIITNCGIKTRKPKICKNVECSKVVGDYTYCWTCNDKMKKLHYENNDECLFSSDED